MTNLYDDQDLLGTNKIIGSAPAANPGDLVPLSQVQTLINTAVTAAIDELDIEIPDIPLGATVGSFRSGFYSIIGNMSTGTSATLGNGALRLYAFLVPKAITLSAIGCEVTTAGDVGCTVRLGIYADVNGLPSTLVADAGTIAGDVVGSAEVATSVTLQPGIYWIGGAVQGVTTTQPTMRTIHVPVLPIQVFSTSMPGANQNVTAVNLGGVTGALPATVNPATANSGSAIRCFLKVA